MTQNPIYILNAHIKISIFGKNLRQTLKIPKFKPILHFLAIQRFLGSGLGPILVNLVTNFNHEDFMLDHT